MPWIEAPSQPRSTWPSSRRSWTICWARIRRDREADADVAAGRALDRGVDADHLALEVEGRAARVAAVDRRVDLHEVVEAAGADHAVLGRNDARGDRIAQPERIADRDHRIADPDRVGVRELDVGQGLVCVDLEHGEIGVRIGADHRRRQLPAVRHGDRNLAGIGDHVIVGRDVAVLVEDEAGACGHEGRATRASRHLRPCAALAEEALHEAPEHLGVRTLLGAAELARAGDGLGRRRALHGHADHGRHDLLDQVGIAGPGRGRDRRDRRGGGRRAGVDAGQQRDGCRRGHRDRRDPHPPPVAPGGVR